MVVLPFLSGALLHSLDHEESTDFYWNINIKYSGSVKTGLSNKIILIIDKIQFKSHFV